MLGDPGLGEPLIFGGDRELAVRQTPVLKQGRRGGDHQLDRIQAGVEHLDEVDPQLGNPVCAGKA